MTVGLDVAAVEHDLCAGLLGCPVVGCEAVLGPWGSARERVVRGAGRLLPRRGRCRGCGRTQVLLPASVLLRRADADGAHRNSPVLLSEIPHPWAHRQGSGLVGVHGVSPVVECPQ